jgi:TPR repeat protein
MYATGWGGVVQDVAEAARWYRRAAEQGYVPAQLKMGEIYAAGYGIPQNGVEAMAWYRRAAERGHANAQYNLGVAYETGRGVTQDAAVAVRWFRPAAEQGSASAQFALGDMYARGAGVAQDTVIAYMWLSLAASQEAPLAKQRRTATGVFDRVTEWFMRRVSRRPTYELTSATTVLDEVADRMTSAQITEAQRLAREWEALHPREP